MMPCLECGRTNATLVTGKRIYPHREDLHRLQYWLCPCGAYCGVHPGSTEPLGAPAGPETRNARTRAHARFDPLWQDGEWSRKQAYAWLAGALGIEPEDCHIGMFDKATALRVVEVCDTLPRPQPEWVRKLLETKP